MSDNGYNGGSGGASPVVFVPSYLEIKGWCGFRDRSTLGLTEEQAREIIAKLRKGLDLDSIARVSVT